MNARIQAISNEFIGNNAQKSAFIALVSVIGFTFSLYIYLVGSIIFGAVEQRQLEASARELRADIGVLEIEYLGLAGKINLDLAHSLGFKEATDQVFAVRKDGSKLSLGHNER